MLLGSTVLIILESCDLCPSTYLEVQGEITNFLSKNVCLPHPDNIEFMYVNMTRHSFHIVPIRCIYIVQSGTLGSEQDYHANIKYAGEKQMLL